MTVACGKCANLVDKGGDPNVVKMARQGLWHCPTLGIGRFMGLHVKRDCDKFVAAPEEELNRRRDIAKRQAEEHRKLF